MKFKSVFVFSLIVIVLVACFVVALDVKKSEIVVHTKAYQNLTLKFVDTASESVLQTYSNRSRKFGELRWMFYTVVGEFKLFITDVDTNGAEPVEYGPFQSGSPVEINFSGWSVENKEDIVEDEDKADSIVEANSSNLVNYSEMNEKNSPLTGFTIGDKYVSPKTIYFVVIGAFVLVIAAFILRIALRNKMTAQPLPPNPDKFEDIGKIRPSAELKKIQLPEDNTGKKIASLQKQLDELKSQERLATLQKQVAQEKESLRKMQDANKEL